MCLVAFFLVVQFEGAGGASLVIPGCVFVFEFVQCFGATAH